MRLLDRISSGWKAWLLLLLITMGAAAPGVFSLPALDRDESRFAQASKQMLETGDYITIRYQDEFRNKKPAGIHWLQAGATAIVSSTEAKAIWSYRLPSWIGAGLATLATFWCGLALMSRRAAFLGAALFGATLLLTSEAHVAKTDAVLVFLTTLGIGALARLYMRPGAAAGGAGGQDTALSATHRAAAGGAGGQSEKTLALVFWAAMGLGFLIKGPVSIMVAAYAGIGAWVWAKAGENWGGAWWRPLAWWPGPALFFALWIPWFIWIQLATGGTFIEGAVGKDLSDKFTGASEGHAGWAFYHVSHLPVWFFPATVVLVPACVLAWRGLQGSTQAGRAMGRDALLVAGALAVVVAVAAFVFGSQVLVAYPVALVVAFLALGFSPAWRDRYAREAPAQPGSDVRVLRFLVAWVALTWLFFELMPTRLSHYVLPAYPGLALLCGLAGERLMGGARMPLSRAVSLLLLVLGGAVLAIASNRGVDELLMLETAGDFRTADAASVLTQWTPLLEYPLAYWWAGVGLLVLTLLALLAARWGWAMLGGILVASVLVLHVRAVFLPSQTWVQPTVVAEMALSEVCGVPGEGRDCTAPDRVQAVGYSEPSYIFTLGTQNLHPPETRAELTSDPADYPMVYLFNLENRTAPEMLAALSTAAGDWNMPLCETRSSSRYALNYSNGDPVHFVAVRFDLCERP